MKNIIQTQMIPEDFKGSDMNFRTCPGSKSFRRACKQNFNWFQRLFIGYSWVDIKSGNDKWYSKDDKGDYKNMMRSKVGDFVVFERVK